jgi:tRNA (guanine37-N1)-methyltransferase
MMRLDIISIFPEYFAPLDVSLIGKARRRGILDVHIHDLREWTYDKHRTVDDTPYGGGPGMVMKPGPWGAALDALLTTALSASSVRAEPSAPSAPDPMGRSDSSPVEPSGATSSDARAEPVSAAAPSALDPGACPESSAQGPAIGPDPGVRPDASPVGETFPDIRAEPTAAAALGAPGPLLVIPTPSGRPFTQAVAAEYAAEPWLIFGCGRYEGIDSRVVRDARTRMRVDEVSIGDYVLAGGEVAVLVMVEAVGRLLPGVLGNAESVADDSFAPGRMEALLEGPVYTKPPEWRGLAVPEILFSGHHAQIARWRRDEALRRTAAHRPELLDLGALSEHDRQVLREAGFSGGSPGGFPEHPEPMAD